MSLSDPYSGLNYSRTIPNYLRSHVLLNVTNLSDVMWLYTASCGTFCCNAIQPCKVIIRGGCYSVGAKWATIIVWNVCVLNCGGGGVWYPYRFFCFSKIISNVSCVVPISNNVYIALIIYEWWWASQFWVVKYLSEYIFIWRIILLKVTIII